MPSLMGTTASQPQQPQSPALFVKGLSKGITERHLYAVFSQFGQLVDCQVCEGWVARFSL
jgi:RNA recognition motif-containing protein